MKTTSSISVGNRIFKSRKTKRTKRRIPFGITIVSENYYFDVTSNKWVLFDNDDLTPLYEGGRYAKWYWRIDSYRKKLKYLKGVYSLRTAQRKIRKWDLPKGTIFRVETSYDSQYFKIKV